MTNKWDLMKAFEVLSKYGFLYTYSPIIISVEKHFDSPKHLSYFLKAVNLLIDKGIYVVKHSSILSNLEQMKFKFISNHHVIIKSEWTKQKLTEIIDVNCSY